VVVLGSTTNFYGLPGLEENRTDRVTLSVRQEVRGQSNEQPGGVGGAVDDPGSRRPPTMDRWEPLPVAFALQKEGAVKCCFGAKRVADARRRAFGVLTSLERLERT